MRLAPSYRDIFQKALYGQSRDQLSILCEDAVAESLIRGVFDVLNVELTLRHEGVIIGRNTGSQEFPGHVRTLAKFKKLSGFILVLDGDSRAMKAGWRPSLKRTGRPCSWRSCRETGLRSDGVGMSWASDRMNTQPSWG